MLALLTTPDSFLLPSTLFLGMHQGTHACMSTTAKLHHANAVPALVQIDVQACLYIPKSPKCIMQIP